MNKYIIVNLNNRCEVHVQNVDRAPLRKCHLNQPLL